MPLPIEIDASSLCAKTGADLLSHFGVILARALYPRDWIVQLGEKVEQAYSLLGALHQRGALAGNESRWFEFRSFQIALLQDATGSVADRLVAPVTRIAETVLEGGVAVSPFSFVRRVEPDDEETGMSHRLPFHQDERVLGNKLINIWTPFRDCGVTAPGLEVVARRLSAVEQNTAHERSVYGALGAEIPAEQVTESYGDALVAPILSAGDALIFLGTTIHRTHIAPGMTERRDSVDLRLSRC